jgi:hypothetical protein
VLGGVLLRRQRRAPAVSWTERSRRSDWMTDPRAGRPERFDFKSSAPIIYKALHLCHKKGGSGWSLLVIFWAVVD